MELNPEDGKRWEFQYQELSGIRPCRPIEPLHRNPPLRIQLPFVNNIRGLLPMLRNDVLHSKTRSGQPKLLERKLLEGRQVICLSCLLGLCNKKKTPPSPPTTDSLKQEFELKSDLRTHQHRELQEPFPCTENPNSTSTWTLESPSQTLYQG